jgi:hypothetical protein
VPKGNLATVTQVVDSDTIDVDIRWTIYRVCYIGMNTPERGEKLGTSHLIWLWFLLIGRLGFNFGKGLFDKSAYVRWWV